MITTRPPTFSALRYDELEAITPIADIATKRIMAAVATDAGNNRETIRAILLEMYNE